jgi:hypothetical protein
MVQLLIDGDDLTVRLGPWERLGALRRADVRVPLAAVVSARSVDSAYAEVRGIRAPGTGVPGRLLLGTWRRRRAKDFVAVSGKGPGVVIDLDGEGFSRLVVSEPMPADLRT